MPMKNLMSRNCNGVDTVLVPPWQYSTFRIMKKNAIKERLVMACW